MDKELVLMRKVKVRKTFQEINEKIKTGCAVVVTAEEMIDVVERHGDVEAARRIDVVTTGTFSPMCSSGAFLNFGHTSPRIRASKVWLNDVPMAALQLSTAIWGRRKSWKATRSTAFIPVNLITAAVM